MYTSIVSCNVKKNKFCSSTWSTDPITQQPVSSVGLSERDGSDDGSRNRALSTSSYHPVYSSMVTSSASQDDDERDRERAEEGYDDDEAGEYYGGSCRKQCRPLMPLPSMDGVPCGLEFLINLNQIYVKRMVELFDIMRDYETGTYKLYNIVNGANQRIYFAAVSSTPRENCCDVQRKFKVNIVDYSGRVVLVLERPYSCCLDVTNNCWMCCCCWLGSIGGKVSVKQGDGTLIGQIVHSFDCYKPKYNILDADDNIIMRLQGQPCGDCCNVLCSVYCNCNRAKEFNLTTKNAEQLIGTIKKIPFNPDGDENDEDPDNMVAQNYKVVPCSPGFGVNFPKNLGLKWKALIVGALFLTDFMYFENGPVSG